MLSPCEGSAPSPWPNASCTEGWRNLAPSLALPCRRVPLLSCMAHNYVNQKAGTITAAHCSQVALPRRVRR